MRLEIRKINVFLNSIVKEVSQQKISFANNSGIKNLDQDIWNKEFGSGYCYLDCWC